MSDNQYNTLKTLISKSALSSQGNHIHIPPLFPYCILMNFKRIIMFFCKCVKNKGIREENDDVFFY